jgi:hypothetical protein
VMSLNGQPDRADQRSIGPSHHLKIGEVFLQFQRGESSNLPERDQSLEIVQRSSAPLMTG